MNNEFFLSIIAVAFGVFLTQLVNIVKSLVRNRTRYSLEGEWYSWSVSTDEDNTGSQDKIRIKKTLNGIKLSNFDHVKYKYIGTGHVYEGCHISGYWKSTVPGATNSGPFLFTVSPQGNFMYGFYGNLTDEREYYLLGWCLGRKPEDIEKAKSMLSKFSKPHDLLKT